MNFTHRRATTILPTIGVALLLALISTTGWAACRDAVLMVHGNTASPSSWNNTYNRLVDAGWASSQIVRANWGSKTCAACNDHYGSELTAVKSALSSALSKSCTGKVDVVAHSMGVTLAAKAIVDMGKAGKVNSFIGIAGAQRGLNSCGTYPYNVWSTTCGKWGLSKKSALINAIKGQRYGAKVYSIKSWADQVVCVGTCFVDGTHTSNLYYQSASYTYAYGHFGLQSYTSAKQVELIQR